MYTLHNVNYIRRPEAVKSVNTAIIVFVYMIKFDKGAGARTNVTHERTHDINLVYTFSNHPLDR